jgi:hypothetical protein
VLAVIVGAVGSLALSLATGARAAAAEPAKIGIELNKLETTDKGCRAYLVVDNAGDAAFQSYKLDLVLFQPDGVIGKRVTVDLAPVRAKKRTVKLFDLDIACERIASVLVNDVIDCRAEGASASGDCMAGLSVKSLTAAQIGK